jgi:hypothetical protein
MTPPDRLRRSLWPLIERAGVLALLGFAAWTYTL